MHNYEELIDKIDKTAAAFSNHLGDNNMSDFLREPIKAIKQLVAERDELLAALKEMRNKIECRRQQLAAERAECEEQARLNGMGAEREAALLAKVDGLERELTATQHVVAQYAEGERKLRAELVALRKQIDELQPVAYFDDDTSTLTFNKTIPGHAWKPVYLLEGIKK